MQDTLTLLSKEQMPIIGLGTWQAEPETITQAITSALECGYRHIDCAPIYHNETAIGTALTQCLNRQIVRRDELWVTSKLWNSYHAGKDVAPALKRTLHDLQLEYLDLYLIHWPVACKATVGTAMPQQVDDLISLNDIPLLETWHAMEDVARQGLVKNIGVSNFAISDLQKIITEGRIIPAVNQIECHPYLSQEELISFCHSHHIAVTAYSPLGLGGKRDTVVDGQTLPSLLNNNTISKVASKHNVTAAQVLLAWQFKRRVCTIPKSTHKTHIEDNYKARQVALDDSDMEQIDLLNQDYRYINGNLWTGPGSPYTAQSLWQAS